MSRCRRVDLGASLGGSPVCCSPAPRRAPSRGRVQRLPDRLLSRPIVLPLAGTSTIKLWVKIDPGTEVEIRADGKRLTVSGENRAGSASGCPSAGSLLAHGPVTSAGGLSVLALVARAGPAENVTWEMEVEGSAVR